jgi:hypothetical protein
MVEVFKFIGVIDMLFNLSYKTNAFALWVLSLSGIAYQKVQNDVNALANLVNSQMKQNIYNSFLIALLANIYHNFNQD